MAKTYSKVFKLNILTMKRCFSISILIFVFISVVGCTKEDLTLAPKTKPSASEQSQKDKDLLSTSEQEDLAQTPDEMLSRFSVSGYTKGGKRQWKLEGKSADIGSEDIKLRDVTGRVYGKDTNMTVVADTGVLNRINNSVHLEKNVKVTGDDGSVLTTDYLDWDAQKQRLTSDAPVWIKRGLIEARGIGIIAQPVLNLVELKKDVTVEMVFDKEVSNVSNNLDLIDTKKKITAGKMVPSTVITCDGALEVDYQNNLAVFNNNVKVKDNRGEIFADKMDVYFATQTDKSMQVEGMEGMAIKKVVATGNVQIHRADNITYSQKAVYDTDTGKLILTGQPKLVIYSTEGFKQMMGSKKTGQTETEEEKIVAAKEEE
jgi:LPS export ABC transporter protein LptC